MPPTDVPAARPLDAAAVDRAVRRMAVAATPPWLHGEVARRLGERLALVRARPAKLLDWSAFLGAGESVLQGAQPQAERLVAEPHPALAARAAGVARGGWLARLRRPAAPAAIDLEAPGDTRVGLVWSNMALHGVADPPRLFAQWEQVLAADGFVMFSCLGPGTLPELRALYAAQGWGAPTQPFVDMHDLGDMLVHAGFADPVMDQELLTLTWPDAPALLAELRGLGGNAATHRFRGLRTPRWHTRLVEALAASAGADGRIALRFEVVYGHAFKAPPRLRADAPTTVSLDDMRALVKAPRRPG
jgi:malonyl-CoA O-methyltransferase